MLTLLVKVSHSVLHKCKRTKNLIVLVLPIPPTESKRRVSSGEQEASRITRNRF